MPTTRKYNKQSAPKKETIMSEKAEKAGFNDEFYEEDEDTQKGKYLTFRLAKEDYGIEIRHVTEIIGIQKITEIPELPDYIKGVINLRGKVIPVMDVRTRFSLPPREYDERTCIIVVDIDDKAVGLVVDQVNEVADIPEENIEPPPRTRRESGRFIQGLGKMDKEVKILLDGTRLLYDEDLAQIAGAIEQ
jgi:purine-binding chemotaxis protein CheW